MLTINANVQGVDGEVYSEYAKGEKFKAEPPEADVHGHGWQRQEGRQRQPGVWLRWHLLVLMASTQEPD